MSEQRFTAEQVAEYVEKILAARQRTVGSIIEQGKLLDQLRQGTDHGQWGPLFNEPGGGEKGPLRMSDSMAYKLIKIANHATLSNPEHAHDLPLSWDVLHELSQIPADRLEELIANGSVHPGLQRKSAEVLVRREISRKQRRGRSDKSGMFWNTDQPKREVFHNKAQRRHEPGPVQDVLNELAPLVYQAQYLIGELAEQKKEIRSRSNFKEDVRDLANALLIAADTLLAIVNDDPGAVLSTRDPSPLGEGYHDWR